MTDLLDALDCTNEQMRELNLEHPQEQSTNTNTHQDTNEIEGTEVTNTMDATSKNELTEYENNDPSNTDPGANISAKPDGFLHTSCAKAGCKNHDRPVVNSDGASIKGAEIIVMEENDINQSAQEAARQQREDSLSSAEDESSDTGENSIWRRKKVVKKRKLRSEQRDHAYEIIDIDETQDNANQQAKKSSGYENADIQKIQGNRNKGDTQMAAYSLVTRKRITSDISGRMVIKEGLQYADTDEYSKKVQIVYRSEDKLGGTSRVVDAEAPIGGGKMVVLEDKQENSACSEGSWREESEEGTYSDTVVASEEQDTTQCSFTGIIIIII